MRQLLKVEECAQEVRALLEREGATGPFWTTTSGPSTKPALNIVCQDLKMLHALDDFLRSCVDEYINKPHIAGAKP